MALLCFGVSAMGKDKFRDYDWSRTHYIKKPEERKTLDRRKSNCFIAIDQRSGIACRRRERQRRIERKIAYSKVTFYPEYYRIM
jgi:hypothetical protein